MGDSSNYLCCNIEKCKILLTDKVWITRCLHVFCPEHGHSSFSNKSSQLSCPVCNEIIVKETDLEYCDINPGEMILAGLPPEKVVSLVAKSVKLWRYQAEAEYAYGLSKFNDLSRKYNTNKYLFHKNINKMKIKYEAEIAGLKAFYDEIGSKLRQVTEELQETKRNLKKYQLAYNSLKSSKFSEKYNHRQNSDWNLTESYSQLFYSPSRQNDLDLFS